MKSEQRTIDGVGYTCTQMDGMRAVCVSARLAKHIGESAVHVLAGATQWKEGTKPAEIMMTIGELLPSMDEGMITETIRDLFKGKLTADNIVGQNVAGDVWQHFDLHFAGRMVHLFAVMRFALEVNFRDFFGVLPLTIGEGSSQEGTEG